jgi:endoglucanase
MEIIVQANAAITGRRATMLTAPEVVTTQSFDIFPNPARDRFTLAVNNSYAGKMEVHILNMIGAVQKQFSLSKASGASVSSLHIGDLPKGQYILLVEMNGHKETKKFIKQ